MFKNFKQTTNYQHYISMARILISLDYKLKDYDKYIPESTICSEAF